MLSGVITAQQTTGGSVAEDCQLLGLIQQHEQNTSLLVETVVADSRVWHCGKLPGLLPTGDSRPLWPG